MDASVGGRLCEISGKVTPDDDDGGRKSPQPSGSCLTLGSDRSPGIPRASRPRWDVRFNEVREV